MTFRKTLTALLLGIILIIGTSAPVMAKTVVKMLHIESNKVITDIWADAERIFEILNPDIDVQLIFLENQAFKAKLPTLLQSKDKPDIFYSFGGGNFKQRAADGILRDITPLAAGLLKQMPDGGMKAFTYKGKIYGAPYQFSKIGFWYNKKMFAKAGINAGKIKTWDDFLATVTTLKNAGITPISIGGADKWPVHFYWSYLAMRIAGYDGFQGAMNSHGKGWEDQAFVRAGTELQRLAHLKPFQKGHMATGYDQASGAFGDHKAAMHLMGDWDVTNHRAKSVSKKGVTDDDLAWFPFPTLSGGKGDINDSNGGINGWVFSKGASDESVKWLTYFLSFASQKPLAEGNHIITATIGTSNFITNPFTKVLADGISKAKWHQVFLDQELGSDVGSVINDVSAELITFDTTPEKAVKRIQEAWEMR